MSRVPESGSSLPLKVKRVYHKASSSTSVVSGIFRGECAWEAVCGDFLDEYPGEYPGEYLGEYPGEYLGEFPGEYPGEPATGEG